MGRITLNRILFSLTIAAAALISGAAQAQPVSDNQIRVAVSPAGLDLNTLAGAWSFQQRVKVAATRVCMVSRGIDNTGAADSLLESCVRQTVKAAMAGQDHKR